MRKTGLPILIGIFCLLILTASAFAHCEIPCGIYDDVMRIHMIMEHITTIEKSMNQINALARKNPVNYNQLVRWVTNKEEHADETQHIITRYFMTQRIKPDMKEYTEKLVLLHKMLIYCMKCKQTTDMAHVETLRTLTKAFHDLYFHKKLTGHKP